MCFARLRVRDPAAWHSPRPLPFPLSAHTQPRARTPFPALCRTWASACSVRCGGVRASFVRVLTHPFFLRLSLKLVRFIYQPSLLAVSMPGVAQRSVSSIV